jgi:hypothetical protein
MNDSDQKRAGYRSPDLAVGVVERRPGQAYAR